MDNDIATQLGFSDGLRDPGSWLPVDFDVFVGLTITGAPGGDWMGQVHFSEGSMVFEAPGSHAPIVELTIAWKYAKQVAELEIAPSVAYMRGLLKPSGDMPTVLELLRFTDNEAFSAWLRPAG